MDTISPDLAEKVLTADLRNLIKKVSDGGNLSSAARVLFQKAALLPSLQAHVRIAALFRKWAAGGRLAADELAELHAWSRQGDETPQLTSDEPEKSNIPSVPPVPSVPPLSLEPDAPRIVGTRVRYPQTYAEYAATYHHGERTVKRWVADGREAEPLDLPPLHRPAEMPDWFRRRYPHREVPDELLDAARPVASSAPQNHSAEVVPSSEAPPPPPLASTKLDFSAIESLGFEENVEELRRSYAIATHLWNEARREEAPDENKIAGLQRERLKIIPELRKAEADLVEWKIRTGDYVPKTEVRAENNRIAATVFNAVSRLVRTVRPALANKPEAEQDRIWREAVLTCFSALKSAQFSDFAPA